MLRISNHFVSTAIALLLALESLVLIGSAYLGVSLRFLDVDSPLSLQVESLFLYAL